MHVERLIADHPAGDIALICGESSRTWAELRASVTAVSASLVERVAVGDVVVVLGDTSIDFVEAVLGSLAAGATVLPLHSRYPEAELRHACELADPKLMILATGGSAIDGLSVTTVEFGELLPGASSVAVPGSPGVEVDADQAALLLFTSGTAGSPRLAMLSRANIAASIRSTVAASSEFADASNVVLGVMPLTHVLGLVSVLGVALSVGATLVLTPDPRVAVVVDLVERHQVSMLVAPPVFWFRLAETQADGAAADAGVASGQVASDQMASGPLASVRVGLSGAAPLTGSLARRIEAAFGIELRQGYGLTEASPALTTSVGTQAPSTSVGRPLPGVELRLVDEFGDDALIGDVGEVWARGDNIFLGYLGDPEATAAVVDEAGWLRTGDLAVVDEHGHLFIVGRNKDQIICAGFNVHPSEVEDWLVQHPTVDAAAVIGEPDREYGEVVVAVVVPADGATVVDDDLRAHCRSRLAGYKVPARFEIVEALPRTATGKLQRRVLRAQ